MANRSLTTLSDTIATLLKNGVSPEDIQNCINDTAEKVTIDVAASKRSNLITEYTTAFSNGDISYDSLGKAAAVTAASKHPEWGTDRLELYARSISEAMQSTENMIENNNTGGCTTCYTIHMGSPTIDNSGDISACSDDDIIHRWFKSLGI